MTKMGSTHDGVSQVGPDETNADPKIVDRSWNRKSYEI